MNIEEFVAHSGNVNCLRIGKKACRNFLTGGDDLTVNLWSIGKPEPLTVSAGLSISCLIYIYIMLCMILKI